jgi:hypothetical protein
MLRCSLALALIAGCGVEIDGNQGEVADAASDSQTPLDAAVDAPIDARPCTGGDGAMMSGTQCLVVFDTPRTFADAMAQCAAFGSQLLVIRNAQDDAVARMLAGTADLFMGLSDTATEGTFVWVDGSALVYSNWYLGEPNNGNGNYQEDCGVINGARGGQWDDRPCAPTPERPMSGQYGYLCQF